MNEHNLGAHPLIVVDVGCRWGFAEHLLNGEHAHNFRIYGFDPDADECQRLQKIYEHFPQGGVQCIPLALGGKEGRRDLFVTKEPACSSLHTPIEFLSKNYPALDCIKKERVCPVKVVTLKSWADSEVIDRIDYIKVDTQGSELEILRGAGDILNTTRCIDIEVEFNPIYEGQALFCDVDMFLRSKGFRLWRLSNLVHYSLGGTAIPLGGSNAFCYDTHHRYEVPVHGGQLFWADARYIHNDVIECDNQTEGAIARDKLLFDALGMLDILEHIERVRSRRVA
ncbi:MAG TPA: FkbM family methyltransferase [Candidatus Competibacter sp.]|nr:FkbM family methyltransferase [Candidatus Competibacter sp.]